MSIFKLVPKMLQILFKSHYEQWDKLYDMVVDLNQDECINIEISGEFEFESTNISQSGSKCASFSELTRELAASIDFAAKQKCYCEEHRKKFRTEFDTKRLKFNISRMQFDGVRDNCILLSGDNNVSHQE